MTHPAFFSFRRRFGSLDGGRFCFEGGSRCGRGEGAFVLRVDDPGAVNAEFERAARGKMEARRKQGAFKSGCELLAIDSCFQKLK